MKGLNMYQIDWDTGFCVAGSHYDAVAVFNALCKSYLHVRIMRNDVVVLEYDNR